MKKLFAGVLLAAALIFAAGGSVSAAGEVTPMGCLDPGQHCYK